MDMFKIKKTVKAADKTALSLGKAKKVRGVTVRKMHIGAYLHAINRLQSLPEDLLKICFPGQTFAEITASFLKMTEDRLISFLCTAFTAFPSYVVSFISDLTGVDEQMLLTDPEIGLNGLAEIIAAFIEVNELGEFAGAIRRLIPRLTNVRMIPSIGSKNL